VGRIAKALLRHVFGLWSIQSLETIDLRPKPAAFETKRQDLKTTRTRLAKMGQVTRSHHWHGELIYIDGKYFPMHSDSPCSWA